jgi:hypothetical protein
LLLLLLPSPSQATMNQDQAAQFEQAINDCINAAVAAALAARPPPQQQPPAAVSAVAVKLPEFWTSDPVMWFRQAEACFRRSNITTSSTMYDHVLMKLPEAVVISVRSLINEIQPGANDAYERLKERLTDSYAKTRWQQAFALIKHPDLGDRRPSALMDEMLALLPTGARSDDTIFLALFLLRLPTSMRDHLAAADHKNAADMARHDDTIWDSRAGETAVAAVAAPVDAVAARSPARDSRRRSLDRRQPGGQRQQRRQTPGPDRRRDQSLCYYHGRFGKKAHKCEAPCSWTEN